MGIAAYNRGSRALRERLDREAEERRRGARPCGGKYANGPGKSYAYCARCGHVDYEANEGDRHA